MARRKTLMEQLKARKKTCPIGAKLETGPYEYVELVNEAHHIQIPRSCLVHLGVLAFTPKLYEASPSSSTYMSKAETQTVLKHEHAFVVKYEAGESHEY